MTLHPASNRSAERGFSVLELIIALFIAVEILIAMAIAFDIHDRVARVQLQVTDMQQSLRVGQWDIARLLRMAGRGGLKAGLDPAAVFVPADPIPAVQGLAIEVRNNVPSTSPNIARGDNTSPRVFLGTDVLAVRGCFSDSVFQIDPGAFDADADADGTADDAVTVTVPRYSVAGLEQPLGDFVTELGAYPNPNAAPVVKARVLISSWVSRDDWGIGEVTAVDATNAPNSVTLTLDLNTTSTLNPVVAGARKFPVTMAASAICFLEEYRYYIRDVQEAADNITPLRPRLTRARFEPGTETAYLGLPANFSLDLAEQIFDLQVALGLDTDQMLGSTALPGSFEADFDDIGPDDAIYEATVASGERGVDDWLYNSDADDPTNPLNDPALNPYTLHQVGTLVGGAVDVYFVRVTTAARTAKPDGKYLAPDLDIRGDGDWLEDNDYDDPVRASSTFNGQDNRRHRRRTLTTIIEMRNI